MNILIKIYHILEQLDGEKHRWKLIRYSVAQRLKYKILIAGGVK